MGITFSTFRLFSSMYFNKFTPEYSTDRKLDGLQTQSGYGGYNMQQSTNSLHVQD
jgi:hypothetical protein